MNTELIARLRDSITDYDGSQMKDGEEARQITCKTIREAADALEAAQPKEPQGVKPMIKAKVLPTDFGIPPKYSGYAEDYANFKISEAAQPWEPLFWYRPVGNDGLYEGPLHHKSVGGKMMRDEKPNEWKPLYTHPATLRAALDAPQAAPDMVEENDKAVGKKWREDSRLEEWFPITAEKLAALEVEVHKLRMRHPLGEAVAWRRWNNKWHEYEYAGSSQLDGGSLFDWEPLAAVPRAALDAPATPITQQMIDAGVAAMYQGAWESDAAEVKSILTAALGAPANPPCQMCENVDFDSDTAKYCQSEVCLGCTDFDKFQALPPIVLTKVTK